MPTSSTTVIVRAENVSKQVFSGNTPLSLLHAIDLTIYQGESVAIVGASGSGKSTLLGLLAGLDDPTSGRIFLHQQDITQLDEEGRAALRANTVGFVFQSFQLLPRFTALENVMLPLELQKNRQAQETAERLLHRMGLFDRRHHYPVQLSGGEQQRIALARAFVTRPRILFADEVTGNLDTETGKHVIEQLFELNQEFGTTLVLVTHDANIATRCHRVFTLENGHLSS